MRQRRRIRRGITAPCACACSWVSITNTPAHSPEVITSEASLARRLPAAKPASRAPHGAPVHYAHHRPEQTTLYRLVQQHAAAFFEQAEAAAGAGLPQFVKEAFDACLECGIPAHGFLRLHCSARRVAQTAAHLVDHVIPRVHVRHWVLALPIPLRLLLAAQPKRVTPVLQAVYRVVMRHLLVQADLKADEADSGAATLIQSFGSPCRLHLIRLVSA
jgi:hypothetical protein